jgi:hypothetical protein
MRGKGNYGDSDHCVNSLKLVAPKLQARFTAPTSDATCRHGRQTPVAADRARETPDARAPMLERSFIEQDPHIPRRHLRPSDKSD